MRKKKNEIFIAIKEYILNNAKSYFIVIIIFTVGLFLGVMLINQTENKSEIEKYINTYVDETKTLQDGNYLEELQNDINDNIIFRGFCLGYTIASCVYVLGKIKGIIFVIITIFLQKIIFIPAIMILGVSSIKLYTSIIKDRRKENIKFSILKHTIISFIIMIALIVASIIKIEISYRLIVNFIKYF